VGARSEVHKSLSGLNFEKEPALRMSKGAGGETVRKERRVVQRGGEMMKAEQLAKEE
jgi:hypothetical protein